MPNPLLSDAQLKAILSDPRFNASDLALLAPDERRRLEVMQGASGGKEASSVEAVKDFGRGAGKGAGETSFNLGRAVHNIPGVGMLTDEMSAGLQKAFGVDPRLIVSGDKAFSETPPELTPTNTAQKAGKITEQVGEFLVPAGAARKAAIEGLVKGIPNAASPNAMRILNRLAALVGRSAGEAGSAAGVSMAHGEENPEHEALAGALGPVVGEGGAAAANLIKTPLMQRLLPILTASGMMSGAGAVGGPAGLGASMGLFGMAKKGAQNFWSRKTLVPTLRRTLQSGASIGGRTTAGAIDQVRASRRRLEQ